MRLDGLSKTLVEYLKLERELRELRHKNGDTESAEEDALLDLMDDAWYKLTPQDRSFLDNPDRME